MSRDTGSTESKVYLGNLGSHPPSTAEVEKEMGYYGKLVSVWIARRPPGFGYVEFEDPRDAKDAIRDLDGRTVFGRRLKVELSHGRRRENRRLVSSHVDLLFHCCAHRAPEPFCSPFSASPQHRLRASA